MDIYINFILFWLKWWNNQIYNNGEIDQKLIESQTNKMWLEDGVL